MSVLWHLIRSRLFLVVAFAALLLPQMALAEECPADRDLNKAGAPSFCRAGWRPYFSIGPALSALSINMETARIGLLDKAAALELHSSNLQYLKRTSYRGADGKNEVVSISFWEWGAGFQVQKPQTSADIVLGVYVVPYGIRVNNFAIGIGLLYNAVGEMSWKRENFSLIVPLTYQLNT